MSAPPRLPDAVYDEIADALVAEAERRHRRGRREQRYVVEGAEADPVEVEREDPCTCPRRGMSTRGDGEADSTSSRSFPREESNQEAAAATPFFGVLSGR